MFSTPQHMEYSSPTDMSRPGDEMDTHKGPVLFGNKRRSTAVARTPSFMSNSPMVGISAPSSDIFASPAQTALPSHMREATPSGGKSVHWSPALVTDRNMSSPLVKPTQGICTPSSNAPPLKSLRDGFDSTQKSTRRSLSTAVTHPLNQTNSSIIMGNDSAIEETTSSSDNWVTVFGFSPDQAHSILQYMSRHGEVVMHQVPSKGNWMYVGYSCSTHARQALSRNGAVLDGNIRIGVIPTSEKELTGLNVGQISTSVPITLNRSTLIEQSIREEPEEEGILQTRDQNVSIFDNSMNNSRMSTVSRAGMRPLNNSFRPREVPLEEKTETFMSKLWNTVGF